MLLTKKYTLLLPNTKTRADVCPSLTHSAVAKLDTTRSASSRLTTTPYHWPYLIPMIDRTVVKGEINSQVDLGLLEQAQGTE